MSNMERIDKLIKHPVFETCMQGIRQEEKDRVYCLHGFEHSLDVARISYIMNLEQGLGFEKDIVYAMALLHDIGRFDEYRNGTSHHEKSAELAKEILVAADYLPEEIEIVCNAIRSHKQNDEDKRDLAYLLYKADKLSRKCFDCQVVDQCYWSEDKKNHTIKV